jgi:hypothetical protein
LAIVLDAWGLSGGCKNYVSYLTGSAKSRWPKADMAVGLSPATGSDG